MQINDSKKSYLNSLVFDQQCYEKIHSPSAKVEWQVFWGEESKYIHKPLSFCKKLYVIPTGFLGSIAMTVYRLFFLTLSLPWTSLSSKEAIKRIWFVALRGINNTYSHALLSFSCCEKKAAFKIQENDFQIQCLFNLYGNEKNKNEFLNRLLEDFSKLDLSDQIKSFFAIYDLQENDQKQIKEQKLADAIDIFSIGNLFRQNVKEKFRDFLVLNLQKIEDKKVACEKLSKLLEEWPVAGVISTKKSRKQDLGMMADIAGLMPEDEDHDFKWIKELIDDIILSTLSCDVYTEIFSLVDALAKNKKGDRFLKTVVNALWTLYTGLKNNKNTLINKKFYTEEEFERRELLYLSMISYAYSSIKDKQGFDNPLANEDDKKIKLAEREFLSLENLPEEVLEAIKFLKNVEEVYKKKEMQDEKQFVKDNINELFGVGNDKNIIRKKYKQLIKQFHPDGCLQEKYKKYHLDATHYVLSIYLHYSS